MGRSFNIKLILLCTSLAAVATLLHSGSFSSQSSRPIKISLHEYLADIPGWQQKGTKELDREVVLTLELDDYSNSDYVNDSGTVSLYIGQYYSAQKIGAVHHPLVCMPGQGLIVTKYSQGEFSVENNSQTYNISYSSIITKADNQKSFVVYWFQAGTSGYSNTFKQKLTSFWNSLTGINSQNGYVRITTPLNGKSIKEAKALITEFINDFYPVYLDYLIWNDSDTA